MVNDAADPSFSQKHDDVIPEVQIFWQMAPLLILLFLELVINIV